MVARVSYEDDDRETVRESMIAAMLAAKRELDALATELRALRRELAARRAVDGWMGASELRQMWRARSGAWVAGERLSPSYEAQCATAPDYPALAAALGLEVEDG